MITPRKPPICNRGRADGGLHGYPGGPATELVRRSRSPKPKSNRSTRGDNREPRIVSQVEWFYRLTLMAMRPVPVLRYVAQYHRYAF